MLLIVNVQVVTHECVCVCGVCSLCWHVPYVGMFLMCMLALVFLVQGEPSEDDIKMSTQGAGANHFIFTCLFVCLFVFCWFFVGGGGGGVR